MTYENRGDCPLYYTFHSIAIAAAQPLTQSPCPYDGLPRVIFSFDLPTCLWTMIALYTCSYRIQYAKFSLFLQMTYGLCLNKWTSLEELLFLLRVSSMHLLEMKWKSNQLVATLLQIGPITVSESRATKACVEGPSRWVTSPSIFSIEICCVEISHS